MAKTILLATALLSAIMLLRFSIALHAARTKFKKLQKAGIPIMPHSYLLGHLLIVKNFYSNWAPDANFIQTFGYYVSLHWRKHFPHEPVCPPVIYVDAWPIATPMAFSMEAYVSNQIELGKSLPKSPMQGDFLRPISNGRDLNCMHGEEWRTWRSRFNPGFSKSSIRSWVPSIIEEVEAFVDVIRSLAGQKEEWGPVFQLEKISGDLAFDATGRVVVNKRFRSLSSHPEKFAVLYRRQLEEMEITLNIFKLLWRTTPFFKRSVANRRREIFNQLHPLILESLKSSTTSPSTIVSAAVKEYSSESGKTGPIDEAFISLVLSQLMIFFFGGEDAISIVIPWMLTRLAQNPDTLLKLREEHSTVLGSDPSSALQNLAKSPHLLDSLQYSHAVIKETLRLNPATITIREGQADFHLAINGAETPWPTHGFDLLDSSLTIHRSPQNFPRPLEFLPERFLVPERHDLHPPKNTWRGFQLGPRQCIGQEMAMTLLKLVLVALVRTFDIEPAWNEWDRRREALGVKADRRRVEGERMYTTGKATSHPKDGCPVHVRLRRTSGEA